MTVGFASLLTTPVVIERPAYTVDVYGDRVPDWDNVTVTSTDGWLTQLDLQQLNSEDRDGRDVVSSTWRLFLPAAVDVDGFDRVRAAGLVFEVEGRPRQAATRTGPHHIEVELRLTE